MRTFDKSLIEPAVKSFLGSDHKLDVDEWIRQPTNVALTNEWGDVGIAELQGTWQAHYFFKSRGAQAIRAALNFLDEIFDPCYNIPVLVGLTPLTNLKARWMNRRIGFQSQGVVKVNSEPFELFTRINHLCLQSSAEAKTNLSPTMSIMV